MVFSAMMNFSRILLLCSSLVASLVVVGRASAQNPPSSPEPKAGASRPDPQSRITIEVTGGEKETPDLDGDARLRIGSRSTSLWFETRSAIAHHHRGHGGRKRNTC